MKKLALLLSLLALGAFGLVACGGGDEDEATAASESETTGDELAADSKSCGAYERWRLAVVRSMSCREALRVIHDHVYGRPTPDGWICDGGDQPVECRSEAGETIRAPVRNAVLRRWEIEQAGNEWAALFAADRDTCRHMGQPACERMGCERVGYDPAIKNCTPPSSEYRESFADATVKRVVIDGHHATAEFSNSESVEFDNKDSVWFITEEWVKGIARRNFEA